MIPEDSDRIKKIMIISFWHSHKKNRGMNDLNIHWDLGMILLRYRVTGIGSLWDCSFDFEVSVFRIYKFMVIDFESL
jgi:hypothetical protein